MDADNAEKVILSWMSIQIRYKYKKCIFDQKFLSKSDWICVKNDILTMNDGLNSVEYVSKIGFLHQIQSVFLTKYSYCTIVYCVNKWVKKWLDPRIVNTDKNRHSSIV